MKFLLATRAPAIAREIMVNRLLTSFHAAEAAASRQRFDLSAP